jgi:hypothetical protein
MATWATTDDVQDITGIECTAAELAIGEESLAPYINRSPEASAGMSSRDLYWLKRAVAWQTVWIPGQPGYATRMTSGSWSQDGESVTHRSASEELVAPLAARSLRNLSWKGGRTTRILPVGTQLGQEFAVDITQEANDSRHSWEEFSL